jgi:hypothetical protein
MGLVGGIVVAILVWWRLRRWPAAPMRWPCIATTSVFVLGMLLMVPPVRSVVFVALPTIPWAIAGSALATWVLARICSNWPRIALLTREQVFWRTFLVTVPLVGMAAQDRYSEFGLTQIWLQPIVLMGVTMLASVLPNLRRPVRYLVALGAGIDFLIGILLHFSLQHAITGLSQQASVNLHDKQSAGVTFWGDHLSSVAPAIQIGLVMGAVALLVLISRPARRRA